jgi:uncharacterized protein (DUF433 family)
VVWYNQTGWHWYDAHHDWAIREGTRMDKSYRTIITINPNIRSGKPTIRGLRYTVYDILSYLAAGMTVAEILDDFPDLTEEDIQACLSFAADREHQILVVAA